MPAGGAPIISPPVAAAGLEPKIRPAGRNFSQRGFGIRSRLWA